MRFLHIRFDYCLRQFAVRQTGTIPDVSPNLVSKTTYINPSTSAIGYDQYNNPTDVWEYDYGSGSVGSFVRYSHTDYLTSSYDTVSGGYSAPDPSTTIHIRNLPTAHRIYSDSSGTTKKAETLYEYDTYTSSGYHAALVNRSGITGLDSGFTTSYTTRGNPTKVSRWKVSSTYVDSYMQYDIAGNVVATVDPNGNTTTIDYSDRFGSPNGDAQSNAPSGESPYTTAPSTWLSGNSTFAFATKITNALSQIAYTQYDYFTGKPVDTEDINGIKGSIYYDDSLDRPTKGIRAVGNALASQTVITYDDDNKIITVASDKDSSTDGALVTKALYDGLGRTIKKALFEATNQWTITETQYDTLGRPYRTGNAIRDTSITGTASTAYWTTATYDALGRQKSLTYADGSHSDFYYSGNHVLVSDPVGNEKMSETDGLGRLTKVWEIWRTTNPTGTVTVSFPGRSEVANGFLTSNAYDVLDNLTTVTQQVGTSGTTQTRTFAYDALKRLTSAANPESGTISYTYDGVGNLLTKTDARSVVTTLAYDSLNRPTSKTYTGITGSVLSTPNVYYFYDNATLPSGAPSFSTGSSKGKLIGVTYGTSSTSSEGSYFGYDALGRPVDKYQRIGTQNYHVNAGYNLAGMMTNETYPSGHSVYSTFDSAGRLSTFGGNLGAGGTSANYVNAAKYNATGQMIREDLNTSTALFHRIHYNNRLQPYDIRVGSDTSTTYDSEDPNDWQYAAGSWNRGALRFYYAKNSSGNCVVGNYTISTGWTPNNGNLLRADHFVPTDGTVSSWTMSVDEYQYDDINRVQKSWEIAQDPLTSSTPYQQAFSYDRFGNRTIDQDNTWVKDGTVYVEDSLPTGASGSSDGGDSWNWVTSTPSPYSGTSGSQSNTTSGEHQHYFSGATATMVVGTNDYLYAYVYLDPTNPPTEVMLQWNDGSGWEHRAYWGANSIGWGTNGTNSRRYMGALPATGKWVRLEVAASQVGLGGVTVSGMAFSLYDGKATWDRAGKTPISNGGINSKPYTVDQTTNRLQPPSGSMSHDSAGNLTSDSYTNNSLGTFKYDAENHLGEVYSSGTGTPLIASYTYNGEGKRVKRNTTSEVWQIYGISGELLAEYAYNGSASSPQSEYGYREGQLLIRADSYGSVKWFITDAIGTPRIVLDKSGNLGDVTRHDYLPFGEELVGVGNRSSGSDNLRQKFTGYERDTESGLDFAQSRFYSSTMGRFSSSDSFAGSITLPQSLNLNAYVENNPLRWNDPTGHFLSDPQKDPMKATDSKQKGIDSSEDKPCQEVKDAPCVLIETTEHKGFLGNLIGGIWNWLKDGAPLGAVGGTSYIVNEEIKDPSLVVYAPGLRKGPDLTNQRVLDSFKGKPQGYFTSIERSLYRYISDPSKFDSIGKDGVFLTPVRFHSQWGALQSLALAWGQTAEYVVSVTVPKDTLIYEGVVNRQATDLGYFAGGSMQIFIRPEEAGRLKYGTRVFKVEPKMLAP